MTCIHLPVLYIVADSNILIGPMSNSDVVSPGSCSTASVLVLEIHLYTTSLVVKPTWKTKKNVSQIRNLSFKPEKVVIDLFE